MAEKANAGEAVAEGTAEEQGTSQVATEKSLDQKTSEVVTKDAKMERKGSEEKSGKEDSKKDDISKDDKLEPFHKHPGWQRMQRKLSKTAAENTVIREQLTEAMEVLKELVAEKRGDEYKPNKANTKISIPDAQELFDSEMENFLESNEISDEEEMAITEIAKKYTYEVADKKVYLPPTVAHQIYKDLQKETSSEKEQSVSTKPSSSANERVISGKDSNWKPARNLSEAADRAQRLLSQLQTSE